MLKGHPTILCIMKPSQVKLGGHFPGLNFKTRCFMYWEEINAPSTFCYCFCSCLHHCPFSTHLCVVCRHFIVLCCNFKAIVHLTCYHQWQIQGRPPPPIIFRPSWGLTGLKKFFFNMEPPIISWSGWPALPPHPLSEGLDPPLTIPLGSPKEKSQG